VLPEVLILSTLANCTPSNVKVPSMFKFSSTCTLEAVITKSVPEKPVGPIYL
jgi:hypothetical protein